MQMAGNLPPPVSLRVKKMTIFGLTSEPHRLMLMISHHKVCTLHNHIWYKELETATTHLMWWVLSKSSDIRSSGTKTV